MPERENVGSSSVRRILKRGGGSRNFRKFERNIDQNLKLSKSSFVSFFRPKTGEEQKKKGLHSNFVPFFAKYLVILSPTCKGGAMPQFCLLFYAILQSWRPKGRRPWPNASPQIRPWLEIQGGGQLLQRALSIVYVVHTQIQSLPPTLHCDTFKQLNTST